MLRNMEQLVVVDEMYGRVFELPLGETVVGRYDTCEITIPRGSVARRHAVIEHHGDALTLRDNASTNGTYLQRGGAGNVAKLRSFRTN